jgi:hypothetical protein
LIVLLLNPVRKLLTGTMGIKQQLLSLLFAFYASECKEGQMNKE